jgi:tRNA modification GTPase
VVHNPEDRVGENVNLESLVGATGQLKGVRQGEQGETIAAIATPPGIGGIGVVRISGIGAASIAEELLGSVPPSRVARLYPFRDNKRRVIDEGLAVFFKGPSSYTGEDILELHGHGGPLVLDVLLARVMDLGARMAQPGEFTERAFLNGKLDLAQAEAVADLIESRTHAAARAAMRSLAGTFSKEINDFSEKLAELRVYIEADIDFSEDEIDNLSFQEIRQQLRGAQNTLDKLLDRARPGVLLGRGAQVVLAGAPNAGKSSVMNVLAGADRAIVSDQPGTTRDLVEFEIDLDGLPVRLVDTAGLRHSDDQVEGEGIRRATAAIATADLVLLVIDDAAELQLAEKAAVKDALSDAPILRVYNKCDLSHRPYGSILGINVASVAVSATGGGGIPNLLEAIKTLLGYSCTTEDPLIARRRHLVALERADDHLRAAVDQAKGRATELLAEELRLTQAALGEITGVVTTEDLLGQIFSSFCIGK